MDIVPVWSPDSRQVAYVDGDDQGRNLLLVQPLDGPVRVLATRPHDKGGSFPAWSPAGDRIAIEGGIPAGSQIVSTSGVVMPVRASGGSPAWSPDGTRVAWFGYDTVVIVDRAGGSAERIIKLPRGPGATGAPPFWTTSGIVVKAKGRWYLADPDTGGLRELTTFDAYRLFQETPAGRVTIDNTPPAYRGP